MASEEYYFSDSESDYNYTVYDINEYLESIDIENPKNEASRLFLVRFLPYY